ncbi:MAG TPA: hypothetical protein VLG71_02280, partial [Candidatus Limnocylindria bacterium]|nr:hypothetical protein [Candidatus Limnocylindria bacterium]
TKIAYSKEVPGPKGHRAKHIYIADYDGSNAEPLVAKPTINVGSRWRPKIDQATGGPLLFFSQSTNKNMRLMVTNMHGNYKIASNTDGITMLPAFSADGTQVIYCASQGHGSCQLYHYHHGSIKQLTFEGNNISPTFSDDGTRIYYCSDASGTPHIYCYQLGTGVRSQITYGKEGCYSPTYSGKRQQLAYAKMIKGVMQLCVYDEVAKQHMQVTYDNEHKDECSWSPCGNYILCCAERANKGRIALLDIHTGTMRSLTNGRDVCSYPAWSPVYDTYVTVT